MVIPGMNSLPVSIVNVCSMSAIVSDVVLTELVPKLSALEFTAVSIKANSSRITLETFHAPLIGLSVGV
jgi:hypothetical protein